MSNQPQYVETLVLQTLPRSDSHRWITTGDLLTHLFRADNSLSAKQVWATVDGLLDDGKIEREEYTDEEHGFHFRHRLTVKGDVESDRLRQKEGTRFKKLKETKHDDRNHNTKQGGDVMSSKKEFKQLTMKELISYYNEVTPGTPVKTFTSKAVAIRRIKGVLVDKKKPAAKPSPKGRGKTRAKDRTGSKGISKLQVIRDVFKTRKRVTRAELGKLTGWSDRNVHTAMSILKNPARVSAEKLLVTEYDRKTQTYTRS